MIKVFANQLWSLDADQIVLCTKKIVPFTFSVLLFSNVDYDISVFMMSTSISIISGIIDSSSKHYLVGPVARDFVWRLNWLCIAALIELINNCVTMYTVWYYVHTTSNRTKGKESKIRLAKAQLLKWALINERGARFPSLYSIIPFIIRLFKKS